MNPRYMAKGLAKWSRMLLVLACVTMLSVTFASRAQPTQSEAVKIGFIINFMKFMSWPAAKQALPRKLCIHGNNPFIGYMEMFEGKQIGDDILLVEKDVALSEAADCHMLFISRSEDAHMGNILVSLRDQSVATVSDIEDFSRRGGMFELAPRDGRIIFKINAEAAKGRDIRISSRLLQLAQRFE